MQWLACMFGKLAASASLAEAGTGDFDSGIMADSARQDDTDRERQLRRLDRFLAGVERRALRMAQLATGNSDQALDIVQDAMLTLSKNYLHKDETQWGPLFHRIVQNRIRDWYRSQSVRHRVFDWFGLSVDDERDSDPWQQVADTRGRNPAEQLGDDELNRQIMDAIGRLPLRQQQAFLLRDWEGLDVRQTAAAMQCSEGSVKTHYSRALRALQKQLEGVRYG